MKFGYRFVSLVAALTVSAAAQDLGSFPHYTPTEKLTGTLVVWGNDGEIPLAKIWEERFQRFQPGVQFENHLYSTAVGIGGLYAGHADVALMGRDIWPLELQAFQKTFGYDPTRIVSSTGSYDVMDRSFPMVVFVGKDNPVKSLTLAQLDAIFGTELRLGGPKLIRTWGDLGLTGEWANKPIHLYAYGNGSGFGVFFSNATMGGSVQWAPGIHQFDSLVDEKGKVITDSGERIVEALEKDPYGLAYSGIRFNNPRIRPLPIALKEGSAPIASTPETVANRTYPLLRDISIYVNRAPGKPVGAKAREFLMFVLSQEGQDAVRAEGAYVPLPADFAAKERESLR